MKKVFLIVLLVGIALQLLFGSTMARAADKIIAGIAVDPTYTNFVVAKEKGFFEKHRIDAQLKTFGYGALALNALLTGDIHVCQCAELPSISARSKGGQNIQASIVYEAPDYLAILARKDIKRPQDLIGKKVAITRNTSSEYAFYGFCDLYNIPKGKIITKNVAPSEMIAALDRGDVDAFIMWEPWPSKGLEIVKNVHIMSRGGDDGGYYPFINILNFSPELAKNKDLAGRVLLALIDATNFIKEHPDETAQIAAKAFNIPIDLARKSLPYIDFKIEMKDKFVEFEKDAAKWLIEKGAIKKEPDWEGFIDWDLLRAVAPGHVKHVK